MEKKNTLLAGIASLVAVAAAAYLVVRRRAQRQEKPPKNAPQLPVQNPGDQSEFPAAPVVDSSLG